MKRTRPLLPIRFRELTPGGALIIVLALSPSVHAQSADSLASVRRAFSEGQYAAVIAQLKDRSLTDLSAGVLRLPGRSYQALLQHEAAIDALQRALAIDTLSARTLQALGRSYQALSRVCGRRGELCPRTGARLQAGLARDSRPGLRTGHPARGLFGGYFSPPGHGPGRPATLRTGPRRPARRTPSRFDERVYAVLPGRGVSRTCARYSISSVGAYPEVHRCTPHCPAAANAMPHRAHVRRALRPRRRGRDRPPRSNPRPFPPGWPRESAARPATGP